MQTMVCDILEKLLDLRDHFWELDCSQPLWLFLGIRWLLSWLSVHGNLDEE